MATKWSPDFTILIRKTGNKKSQKIELFRATKFSTGWWQGDANLYRIRVNRKWYGRKHGGNSMLTYMSLDDLMELLGKGVKEALK